MAQNITVGIKELCGKAKAEIDEVGLHLVVVRERVRDCRPVREHSEAEPDQPDPDPAGQPAAPAQPAAQ